MTVYAYFIEAQCRTQVTFIPTLFNKILQLIKIKSNSKNERIFSNIFFVILKALCFSAQLLYFNEQNVASLQAAWLSKT